MPGAASPGIRAVTAGLPLLLLNVDGVLNPYSASACPPGYTEHKFFTGEEPVRLCAAHEPWLRELAARFELTFTLRAPEPPGGPAHVVPGHGPVIRDSA
jgi:hypothetical protein